MLTSRSSNTNNTYLPLIIPNTGDTSQRQQKQRREQLMQEASHRPASNDSTQSIDNAYSLEHLFVALRRRIRRIVQTYNPKAFHDAIKVCARLFQSYASYNLHTIDEFARNLSKNARDNKKILTCIDQFRFQLSELRHCHSTFQAELLVTTLAIDFHEDESKQQQGSLSLATGKFSPKSRLSKLRFQHTRQAIDLKAQLKKVNEQLQVLLFDEFTANVSSLWEESEKYILASVPFYDHHMTYVLRLIPDIVLKFEYALQLCTKLFDLETAMVEHFPQTSRSNDHMNTNTSTNTNSNPVLGTNYHSNFPARTPMTMMTLTPRSDFNQSQDLQEIPEEHDHLVVKPNKDIQQTSAFFSADVTSPSSNPSPTKLSNRVRSPINFMSTDLPLNIINQHDDNPIFPPLFPSSDMSIDFKNDQDKLQVLLEQLEKRLIDEELYRKRLLNCVKQIAKKSEQLSHFPRNNMLTLVMSDEPSVAEYQKRLCASDHQVHKSVADELNIAIRETQYRIDWINTVRTRTLQCLGQ